MHKCKLPFKLFFFDVDDFPKFLGTFKNPAPEICPMPMNGLYSFLNCLTIQRSNIKFCYFFSYRI